MMSAMRFVFIAFLSFFLFFPQQLSAEEQITPSVSPSVRPIKELRDTLKSQQEELKNSIKEQQNQRKSEILKMRETIKSNREAAKEEFMKIRDERKRQIAGNIADKINDINTNRTETLLAMLKRMDERVGKLSSQSADLKSKGYNTDKVDAAIQEATSLIQQAITAVEKQSEKTYTYTITDETTVRAQVGTVVKQFQNDFAALIASVKRAKDAVTTIVTELSLVRP